MTKDELLKTADNIQIAISDVESNILLTQLNDIFDYISVIDKYDCNEIEELQFMTNGTNRLREDVSAPSISLKDALCNAPNKNDNFFKVPKVIV